MFTTQQLDVHFSEQIHVHCYSNVYGQIHVHVTVQFFMTNGGYFFIHVPVLPALFDKAKDLKKKIILHFLSVYENFNEETVMNLTYLI